MHRIFQTAVQSLTRTNLVRHLNQRFTTYNDDEDWNRSNTQQCFAPFLSNRTRKFRMKTRDTPTFSFCPPPFSFFSPSSLYIRFCDKAAPFLILRRPVVERENPVCWPRFLRNTFFHSFFKALFYFYFRPFEYRHRYWLSFNFFSVEERLLGWE